MTTYVLYQGDHQQPRQAVEPGFLSALDPQPAQLASPSGDRTTGRRLTLAQWITSPDNPLTARVYVNRIWQLHFGRGLVETPNDFGLAGQPPTHPELLDWLAVQLIRSGWSSKGLQRLIVTSATYRQASVMEGDDPGSDRYQRRQMRRLTAEQVRDALLAVSGQLTHRRGGPPVWPELPRDILQANPAFLDDNAERTKGWYPSPPEAQPVRTIYLVQKRTVRIPFLETFDLPENGQSCGRREQSTVATQALSLMNSPLAIDAARAFAARVEREAGDDPRQLIERCFQLALQRWPQEDERALCTALHDQHGLVEVCRVMLNLNEFVYVD